MSLGHQISPQTTVKERKGFLPGYFYYLKITSAKERTREFNFYRNAIKKER